MTLLWLDDVRPAPAGWAHARSVNDAKALLSAGEVTHASFDHDLGDYSGDGGDGTRLTDWLAETGHWPTGGVRVHSSNPVGVATMLATMDRYAPYTSRTANSRGQAPDGGWPSVTR